jgi:hypothetical protein
LAQQHKFWPSMLLEQFAESGGKGLYHNWSFNKHDLTHSLLLLLVHDWSKWFAISRTTAPCSWLVQVVCYLTHYCSLFMIAPSGLLSVVPHLFVIPILVFWLGLGKKKSK